MELRMFSEMISLCWKLQRNEARLSNDFQQWVPAMSARTLLMEKQIVQSFSQMTTMLK